MSISAFRDTQEAIVLMLAKHIQILCLEQGWTMSVAESCTSGRLASALTAHAGASAYFMAGVVAYQDQIKSRLLDVPTEMLEQHTAVSRAVAESMARGIRALAGSTIGLSTTGYLGPSGGANEILVGTIWISVATPQAVYSSELHLRGVRGDIATQVVQKTLAYAYRMMKLESKI